ncbi:aminotransferase class V-fold PLP-dependent enzyme [Flavitalea sp. BT771]|uniref:aminotransferase class V-fold PLP-dependent enzyme n=1 Tax=Flavitalea sp. BT771 TaxID=3063329 RepID=UPI0026E227EA|nr:aminotransferase class V-fold PLP-dependent enzyme [Flavitalea sp. BT771]MDO6432890.1 aminotransferase class V-fold PLP-dependent enzyme [Flavitalea sp. BT771]MDV6221834.1 aminotransferase class V-fold PLP-dependent enzyme [Flavitalea sp. BT771]
MIIPNQRHLFSIPEDITYLNCANMSPFMRSVEEAGGLAIGQRRQPWTISAGQWFGPAEELRSLFAGLIGAGKDQIALVPSVSYGIAIAKNNIQLRSSQKIVVLDQEYPSNLYAWRELSKASGAEIVTVQRAGDGFWTEAILEKIDGDTGLVAISNCHWTDGSLIDLEQVSRKTRDVGAKLVIDASQSLGAFPLDVRKIRPDFLVTVGYKWLMGPYNLGYLYADPKYTQAGEPIEFSWMVKAGSDDFTRLVEYTDDYKPGARRFDAGEFASFIHIPMATAALSQIAAWGVENIQETLSRLTGVLSAGIQELGWEAPVRESRAGHMVGIRFPPEKIDGIRKKLVESNIYISFRGSSMRIAPHLYNDERDVQRLLEVLKKEG